MIENLPGVAVDGAIEGDRAQAARGDDDGGLARRDERGRTGATAKLRERLLGHPDPRRRIADDAGVGERSTNARWRSGVQPSMRARRSTGSKAGLGSRSEAVTLSTDSE